MPEHQLSHLLNLLDDPDNEVYNLVHEQILSLGTDIIPEIEHFKDTQSDQLAVMRSNDIIQTLRYGHNFQKWKDWKAGNGTAIDAMILIGELLDTEFNTQNFHQQYKKFKQSIWLELNLYMSPLEVFNSLTSIVYSQYNFKIIDSQNVIDKKAFHPSLIFDKKVINQYLFSLLVTTVMDELDTNIKAIKLPYQLLLVYFELKQPFKFSNVKETVYKLSAYLDPKTAEVFTENDIEMFFKKIDLDVKKEYFMPLSYYQQTFLTIYDLYKMLQNSSDTKITDHIKKIITDVFDTEIQ